MVAVVVSPPQQGSANTILYPPLVARTREEGLVGADPSYSYVFAMAVLLDANGNVLEGQLGGNTVVTGVFMLDNNGSTGGGSSSSAGRSSLYFAFPDLYVAYAGTYTLRVDVYLVDYDNPNGARLLAQAETRPFTVYEESVAAERPTSSERSVLRRLKEQGVSLPSTPA
ncbi:hypothetical protein NKR23_g9364 [Pleurostoma richardsiae]|uniref:Velvet domain-containing protein n=1 Tax=Pleurostoma richardsiae TaxID=41990 RepID=A0AA38VN44_9PEZI|nr:hypothetical protein NKR23_g9364 [Pleurostoma richardsiae]